MQYRCLKCNLIHSATLSTIKYKTCGCANCSKNRKLTFEEIIQKISIIDSNFTILSNKSEFKNVHSPLRIKHTSCGITFRNCYNNIRNGQRCPFCEKKNKSANLSK